MKTKTVTLDCGAEATVKAMSYEQFYHIELARIDALERAAALLDEGKNLHSEIALKKLELETNEMMLAASLEQWDALRPMLSPGDVRKVIIIAGELSKPDAEEKNSSTAGNGQATPAGGSTAPLAARPEGEK